jgi:hypothetical protein
MVTDAEVVTLCVAQAIMGIPSDRRFLTVARKRLAHLFPRLPYQPGYFKRRRRLADTIEWLLSVFAAQSPGADDDLLLVDSTPVECARSRETVKRSQLADAADYGWHTSQHRFLWGFRLHALFAPDGTPRALALTSPKRDEREVALELLARCNRRGGETLLGDKGYAGRAFAHAVTDLDARIVRPRRHDEPGRGPHLAPIRQRIESIFWTCKDLLTLERHGARRYPDAAGIRGECDRLSGHGDSVDDAVAGRVESLDHAVAPGGDPERAGCRRDGDRSFADQDCLNAVSGSMRRSAGAICRGPRLTTQRLPASNARARTTPNSVTLRETPVSIEIG